jgi:hypothetical protein
LARKILERIDNQTINKLFESITPEITNEISEKDDFDFHTSSIIKLLGMKGSLKTAQTLISGELKKYGVKIYTDSKQGINDVYRKFEHVIHYIITNM